MAARPTPTPTTSKRLVPVVHARRDQRLARAPAQLSRFHWLRRQVSHADCPEIVSRPGKDILAGVDALVKDGVADPEHLAIAGYSYGGYMTNWLITQTTRFKAAMTGAGAVEHAGQLGQRRTPPSTDAYFLGGRPWEAQQRYHDEAALFQIDKVKTPTHMVAGSDDIRVAVLETTCSPRSTFAWRSQHLLIFPGEATA